jgi:3-methylcrotonyl-CoA carboxylase alpha subunit
MLSSVLIANRGEIACRIARTAKRLRLRTIAVYSEADARAPHVRLCDEACAIGPAPAADSYLAAEKIIAAARRARAECIHPGYGFLAENADFAEACARAGIVFVGPPPPAIRLMGLKDRAKALMEKAGVPVVPGYRGDMQDPAFLKRKAYEIGYPVLVKAVAGGGGKGMRRVDKHAEFDAALAAASREARAAFGDPRVLIEKYVDGPRHIEFQVFADRHGNVIHLGERDCSTQRRHQKIVEEAPAPGMPREMRAAMGRAAIEAARAVGYVGAGTVEFIADGSRGLAADRFWFMEMNTRLQVEHPVTEAVTGLDLVEWQFRVAAGEALPLRQDAVRWSGHAIEARIYAETPEAGFRPSVGTVVAAEWPAGEGVRVDAGVEEGTDVTPFYDPMLAKVIAHGPTREAALDRLANALSATLVVGPHTNIAFLAALVRAPELRAGALETDFVERNLGRLVSPPGEIDRAAAARGVAELIVRRREPAPAADVAAEQAFASPWEATDGFQLNGVRIDAVPILVDDTTALAEVRYGHGGPVVAVEGIAAAPEARAIMADDAVYVVHRGRQTLVRLAGADIDEAADTDRSGIVTAPMHGKLIAVLVAPGSVVRRGERLAVIESMKMEHAVLSPLDGVVVDVAVAAGRQIAEKARILTIAAREAERA